MHLDRKELTEQVALTKGKVTPGDTLAINAVCRWEMFARSIVAYLNEKGDTIPIEEQVGMLERQPDFAWFASLDTGSLN